MEKVQSFFKDIYAKKNKNNIKIIGLSVIGLLFVLISGLFFRSITNSSSMTLLYGNLDSSEVFAMERALIKQGIKYEIREHERIYIESDAVYRFRMHMAEQGYPRKAIKGYELIDNMATVGVSEFDKKVNLTRAIEGELRKTILTMQEIQDAKVHITMRKRDFLSRELHNAKAAVVLTSNSDFTKVDNKNVKGIKKLVASAVSGLSPEEVTVMTDEGIILDISSSPATIQQEINMRNVQEIILENKLKRIIGQIVGHNSLKVNVKLDMDIEKINEEATLYDKENQVERSKQITQKNRKGYITPDNDPITVSTNIPNKNFEALNQQGGPKNTEESVFEQTANYEISQKKIKKNKTITNINKITVAIAIDHITRYTDGELKRIPLNKEEIEQIKGIAMDTVGFDAKRGDSISISNIQFELTEKSKSSTSQLLRTFIEAISTFRNVIAIFIIMGLLTVAARPVLSGMIQSINSNNEELMNIMEKDIVKSITGKPIAQTIESDFNYAHDDLHDQSNEWQQILKSVNKTAMNHPERFSNIIRAWLYQKD